MAYDMKIGTTHPGLILILLDQSASMDEDYGGREKQEVAADVVNQAVYELVLSCAAGTKIKDRCHLEVIGYGAEVSVLLQGKISEIGQNPREVKEVQKMQGGIPVLEEQPVWFYPRAANGTPMDGAFEMTEERVDRWLVEHPDCFPPVIINITDGQPNRKSRTQESAHRLMTKRSADGNVLVFNAHIADGVTQEMFMPCDQDRLPDEYAEYLYGISSVLPETMLNAAWKMGFKPQQGARGFVYNAGPDNLVKLLNFGTMGTIYNR